MDRALRSVTTLRGIVALVPLVAVVAIGVGCETHRSQEAVSDVARRSDDEIVIHIWPAKQFGGRRPRGGGGETHYFSRKAHEITRALAWQ